MKRAVSFVMLFITALFAVGCMGEKQSENRVSCGNSGVFRVGNRAYEVCEYNEDAALKYAELVGEAAEALAGETRVYSLVIPTAYGIMLPEGAEMKERIQAVYDAMPEGVTRVDAWDGLAEHRDEYIYFRTDHHWTARGAYLGYEAFCAAKGVSPIPLEEHREESFSGFLGSFYTESGCDEELLPEETVEAFWPVSEGVTLTVTDENDVTEVSSMVADVSGSAASGKYMTFAGGNNPFSVIDNPEVNDGSVLIVVKESFGNPMLAFLCGHYSRVYVIDYRYWSGSLTDLAREVRADDLLFANGYKAVNTGSNIGFMAMIIRRTEASSGNATEAPTETPAPSEEPTPDPNERPENVTVEWLAAELMRRYNVGRYLTRELADYSDILDRNEDTNLFFYDNQLWIDLEMLQEVPLNVSEVSRGKAEIQSVLSETESEITVDIYVSTKIVDDDPVSGDYAGVDFQIRVDKRRMVIIAFDQPYMCEGIYRNELKPLALRYRKQGLSWEEADRKAYDELHARLVETGWF